MNPASGSIDARLLWAWLLVGLWIGLILLFSGDGFSAHQTSRIIGPLLTWLFPEMPEAHRLWIHGAIRKGGHVTEYAVLAALALRAIKRFLPGSSPSRRSTLASAGLTLLLVLAVASVDEAGQARRETRTGSLVDVGWDLLGGTLGCTVALAFSRCEAFRSQTKRRRP